MGAAGENLSEAILCLLKNVLLSSIKLMEAIQANFAVLNWRTQWVKAERMLLGSILTEN